ncbi:MAG: sporulation protein YqfD [Acutalibacteraceae bacterium]
MFLIKLLRFLSGYVIFRAEGGFGERFINLCSVYDIPLWDVCSDSDGFTACTTPQGYRNIRICAKKSGVRPRIISCRGTPFFLLRFKKRGGVLIGAALFIICLALLSSRVWVIEVNGNSKVPDDVIISAAQEAGLICGAAKNKINAPVIALKTEDKLSSLSWVAININGCCAEIDVREASATPKPSVSDDEAEPRNIVASKDAQLILLEPYSGTAQAKLFNSVMKGDILISGINQNRDESVSFVTADGYAVGRTQTALTVKAADEKTMKEKLIKRVYKIYFFGIEIPLGREPDSYGKKFSFQKKLSIAGHAMPIGVFYTDYSTLSSSKQSINKNQLELICLTRYLEKARSFSQTRQVLGVSISEKAAKNACEITGNFVCYENIVDYAPVEIDETAAPAE